MLRPVFARRHPDQVLVAGLLVVPGVLILAGGPRPGSVSATLPVSLVYVWAAVLVVGGLLLVAAAIVRSAELGLYLELAAHPPLAVMLGVYAASAFFVGGGQATAAGAVLIAIMLARSVRTFQVVRTLRRLRRDLKRSGD